MINNKNHMDILLNGEPIRLLPEKAIYFPKEKSLVIADVHLGKAGHFRNAGIAVPSRLAFVDLEILDDILFNLHYEIKTLYVLGDLFHAEMNIDWKLFEEWRALRNNIEINLIKGNHDKFSTSIYKSVDIEVLDFAILNKFLLVHDHRDEVGVDGLYKISGHIHPAVRIHGKAKQSLTLPCFYFGRNFGLLPAFGKFTGKYIVNPELNDSVFVISGNEGEKKVYKI